MIAVEVTGINELEKALGDDIKQLPRQLSAAINATSKKVKAGISKQIRQELAAPAKDVNAVIKVASKAAPTRLGSSVVLKEQSRLSLKAFGARQTKSGVSYKTSPRKGRKRIDSAFMGPRPGVIAQKLGGHVYKRKGQGRKPITKLMGASPWGAYIVNGMQGKTVLDGTNELKKQILRRAKFIALKRSGAIK